ncbi:hypothetical protein DFH07DRAFT_8000 [Mycena maculata]|uniref:F-box domain-containing protein n=1 Tax=Mycena maculata TaxID=230809 RepID=A0AAD7KH01_9AGAR|nr:hypothetical protein DFH07DRAFT_8000 [Mycena maculata]
MLAEMFMHATAEDQDASDLHIPMHFHFVLSQVCGLWRAVALHTPSMWRRVVLHLQNRVTGFGSITRLARTCFERSCELPLELVITSSISTATSIPNLSMDLVLPVRHRIRHLELRLPVVFTESIFKLPRNSLKALKSISISALVSGGDIGSWFRSMSGLEGAPLLDTVKFSCVHPPGSLDQWRETEFRFDPYVAGLPWAQLTGLALKDLEIRCDDALYALEMATSLVRCTVDLRIIPPLEPVVAFTNGPVAHTTTSDPEPPKPKKPITLPALLVFEVAVSGTDNAPADFFDRLVLPSLVELSIKYKDVQTLPCATLTDLQKRSSFSLERFVLAGRMGDSLVPFFQSNPHICRLQLVFCALELMPLAAAFARKDGGEALLPCLRTLTLADRWAEETPPATWAAATKAVVEMARSRWRVQAGSADARLEAFTFGSRAALSAKKTARINRCREDGMRVRTMTVLPQRAHLVRVDYINMILLLDES